ncbi:MAG: hypothetical protein Q8R34_00805 [bacterium]|nr:hypothetical protein [bacterium]
MNQDATTLEQANQPPVEAQIAEVSWEDWRKESFALLKSLIPKSSWDQFQKDEVIKVNGEKWIYLISPYFQTEIRYQKSGKLKAYSCIQLSLPAPIYLRMLGEYFLIKNHEELYWKTANMFMKTGFNSADLLQFSTIFVAAGDVALAVNLAFEIFKALP